MQPQAARNGCRWDASIRAYSHGQHPTHRRLPATGSAGQPVHGNQAAPVSWSPKTTGRQGPTPRRRGAWLRRTTGIGSSPRLSSPYPSASSPGSSHGVVTPGEATAHDTRPRGRRSALGIATTGESHGRGAREQGAVRALCGAARQADGLRHHRCGRAHADAYTRARLHAGAREPPPRNRSRATSTEPRRLCGYPVLSGNASRIVSCCAMHAVGGSTCCHPQRPASGDGHRHRWRWRHGAASRAGCLGLVTGHQLGAVVIAGTDGDVLRRLRAQRHRGEPARELRRVVGAHEDELRGLPTELPTTRRDQGAPKKNSTREILPSLTVKTAISSMVER